MLPRLVLGPTMQRDMRAHIQVILTVRAPAHVPTTENGFRAEQLVRVSIGIFGPHGHDKGAADSTAGYPAQLEMRRRRGGFEHGRVGRDVVIGVSERFNVGDVLIRTCH